ncbi:MAG: carboxypeptidase regulatory-like domain-containing protein [Acidimicrobiia bacterium]|nr:carboxypeptidase regulatory-like domain-containing protein [Acidimicrobiia bacterium]
MKMKLGVVCALVLALAGAVAAQSTTGTISGRVVDAQGLPVPGVTVTATSPNQQGTRETVTSENGDYGPNFGRAISRFAYTTPRSYRISFGVRF